MKVLKPGTWIILALFILMMTACGSGGSSRGTGTLSLGLTDVATNQYEAVYVTIKEVWVHTGGNEKKDSSWEVVAAPEKTYNLLDLVNGIIEQMGVSDLLSGHYTQMRLIIDENPDNGINILSEKHPFGNYIIDTSFAYHELKIPSGLQTGIKIVSGFDISENHTTELILDFDASRSVVIAGASGQWLLKPTIKVVGTEKYSIIYGTVTDDQDPATELEGVLVSAQKDAYDAGDEKDKIEIQTTTLTDISGAYRLYIPEGIYNMIAYKDGYDPVCREVDAATHINPLNFILTTTADFGQVEINVSIDGDDIEQYAAISFRKTLSCDPTIPDEQEVEIKSINIADGVSYTVSLPVGDYNVVASTYGKDTIQVTISVTSGDNPNLVIAF